MAPTSSPPPAYWADAPSEVARRLGTDLGGLTTPEATRRLAAAGPNELRQRPARSRLRVLWRQVKSPLLLLLVFAAIISVITGELADAAIVAAILIASVGVGYRREYRAETAIALLLDRIEVTANVRRDGAWRVVPAREIVPGDVVQLAAGTIVPGDGVLVEATALFVDEAALTGESFPAAKRVGPVPVAAPLAAREGCVHFGTNVRSGTGSVLIVATAGATSYGRIAHQLLARRAETEFEAGLRHFGVLLLVSMLVMVVLVFAINVILDRPPVETLLFSIALAVGLSPELLPAIVGVNLARAAQALADAGMLCRRIDAIENLGSMDVLCTDKTGTLTEGVARVGGAYAVDGTPSPHVLELAALNAALQTGLPNPMDDALLAAHRPPLAGRRARAELPYDFMRKRLGVIVDDDGGPRLITKGAFARVLEVCATIAGGAPLDDAARAAVQARYDAWSADGIRVLAVATRRLEPRAHYAIEDERDLELVGFVTFLDRVKHDSAATIAALGALGVRVKMITGDSRLVAGHVADAVGLDRTRVLAGGDLDALTDIALAHAVADTQLFVEVDPNQKARILRALRTRGAVVGFFGDGVNDTPAMHAADVSISVADAVDVAKATADLVLVEKHLDVIRRGIVAGRRTFANTLKYVLTTTSANLGNMVSMAIASLALPFLPLTAGQILLNNFLSDVPAIGIASDRVDPELVTGPRRWDMRFIRRFMIEFGLLSSAFDALTFAVLLVGFDASPAMFRTGWFVESLFTELVIALVVRTRRRAWQSRPARLLVWTTVAVAAVALAIPYLPLTRVLGFTAVPPAMMAVIVAITAAYVLAAELTKAWFYRDGDRPRRQPRSRPSAPAIASAATSQPAITSTA